MGKRHWTDSEIEYLLTNYANIQTLLIAKKLDRNIVQVYNRAHVLGLKKSKEYFESDQSGRLNKLSKSGAAHRFKKGHISFNKGKGWDEFMSKEAQERSRKTTFKKGHIPVNAIHEGQPYVNQRIRNGKLTLLWVIQPVGSAKRFAYLKWLWEREVGKVGKGEVVIFKNEPSYETPPIASDLMKITRAENLIRNSGIGTLNDKYIKIVLKRCGINHPTERMIETKRNQILLNRKIKNHEKANQD